MYIIDRHKDFYDHHSHIYGVDKNIVFDRRGSEVLDDGNLSLMAGFPYDRHNEGFLLLEVGNVQYVIRVDDYKESRYGVFESCRLSLEKIFEENRHFFNSPISIGQVDGKCAWKTIDHEFVWKGYIPEQLEEVIRLTKGNRRADLPILKDTSLTKILDSFELWKQLNTYISSLDNDKDVSLHMSEEDKAAIHGFDKHSFRHPTK